MAESGAMPTPEELAEQIRALRIDDILLTTVTTLGQLAYAKLEAEQLDQARLAIDGIAALLPVLEGSTRPEMLRDFNQLLANVRLAYASAVPASGSEPQAPSAPAEPSGNTAESADERDETASEASQSSASGSEPQSPSREGSDDG
jgi:ribosomal protein L12E/L44/L45/RPP1/RPP2